VGSSVFSRLRQRNLLSVTLALALLGATICYLEYPLPSPTFTLLGVMEYLGWLLSAIVVGNAAGLLIHAVLKRSLPRVGPALPVTGYWLGLNLTLLVLIGFGWRLI
jgi:hypothetical protein